MRAAGGMSWPKGDAIATMAPTPLQLSLKFQAAGGWILCNTPIISVLFIFLRLKRMCRTTRLLLQGRCGKLQAADLFSHSCVLQYNEKDFSGF